jgi:hypothetical protein
MKLDDDKYLLFWFLFLLNLLGKIEDLLYKAIVLRIVQYYEEFSLLIDIQTSLDLIFELFLRLNLRYLYFIAAFDYICIVIFEMDILVVCVDDEITFNLTKRLNIFKELYQLIGNMATISLVFS